MVRKARRTFFAIAGTASASRSRRFAVSPDDSIFNFGAKPPGGPKKAFLRSGACEWDSFSRQVPYAPVFATLAPSRLVGPGRPKWKWNVLRTRIEDGADVPERHTHACTSEPPTPFDWLGAGRTDRTGCWHTVRRRRAVARGHALTGNSRSFDGRCLKVAALFD